MPVLEEVESVAQRMSAAAQRVVSSLSENQIGKALHPFSEDRKDWAYVPQRRDGLSLKEMSEEQEQLVFELLRQGLAEQGMSKVKDVISLEDVLKQIEGPNGFIRRDAELYYFWIFGEVGSRAWGWRFEGHHLSINASIVDGVVSMSPSFIGANPAEVPDGERAGYRALASEEDVAFELVETFDAEQRRKAIFDTRAPGEIFTEARRKVSPLPIEGIGYAELTEAQQETLRRLVDVFLRRNQPEIYDRAMEKVTSGGWESVRFGWAGPVDREAGNYYFIQGAQFLIEYDNTQNDNNHIHCVWREFEGDFGEDLLREHHDAHEH